jgi:cell division transport system ATP-binding protein
MEEALIRYHSVNLYQQDIQVLRRVDLELHRGEFVYLIGKVGTGKTSLLKSFYCELDTVDGEATVLGYPLKSIKRKYIPALRRKLGIVFQDFQLLIDRTVYQNLEFVLRATGWRDKKKIKERIDDVLQLVEMSDMIHKFPNELSGGEQQRIVIARAVLNSPEIILADEPTGNLDVETGIRIVELLHAISRQGTLVVMSTHNLNLVKEYPGLVYRCEDRTISNVTTEFQANTY